MRLRTGQAVRYLALASFAAMAFSIAHSSGVVQLLFGSSQRDGAARKNGALLRPTLPADSSQHRTAFRAGYQWLKPAHRQSTRTRGRQTVPVARATSFRDQKLPWPRRRLQEL